MRDASLLSLFYFILNDYTKAKYHADRAIEIAQMEDPEGFAARISPTSTVAPLILAGFGRERVAACV